jgi:hypothetical protein
MITLTYGLKKPVSGDKGSIFFPALEDNFTQLDGHTHNGVNSAKIPSSSMSLITQSILAASWVSMGGGTFRQAVTLPNSMLYDQHIIKFRVTSSGHEIFPTIEKLAANQYYIYVNDNTLGVTAIYV